MKIVPILTLLVVLLFSSCSGSGGLGSGWLSGGIGLGGLLAVLASWERNKSILWAIIHCLFGWLYVIYYVLTRE